MRLLPVFLGGLLVVGLGVGVLTSGMKGERVSTREEITASIQKKVLGIKNAGIREIECAPVSGGVNIDGSHCFVSTDSAEELLPKVKDALESIGATPGWTNDYSVWGAFYAAKADPKRTFGVNISPIDGNRDFEGVGAAQGYKSFIDFVVNSTRNE